MIKIIKGIRMRKQEYIIGIIIFPIICTSRILRLRTKELMPIIKALGEAKNR
jgi:hypothetical protein